MEMMNGVKFMDNTGFIEYYQYITDIEGVYMLAVSENGLLPNPNVFVSVCIRIIYIYIYIIYIYTCILISYYVYIYILYTYMYIISYDWFLPDSKKMLAIPSSHINLWTISVYQLETRK